MMEKNINEKENPTIVIGCYWDLLMTSFKIVKIGRG